MIFFLFLLSTFLLPCPAPPPPTGHREENTCKVSGRSLDSAIKTFLSHHVLKLSPTEAEKKLLLAKEMEQYLTTGSFLAWFSSVVPNERRLNSVEWAEFIFL